MDLNDALDWPSDNNKSQGGGMWPRAPSGQALPGAQPSQPSLQVGNSGGGLWGNTNNPSGPSGPGWNNSAAAAQGNSGAGLWGNTNNPSGPSGPGWNNPAAAAQGNSGGGLWGNTNNPSGPSGPGWNNPAAAAQGNLSVPYEQRLVKGIQGKVITIAGTVKSNPNKLTVDLSAGRDLVFHFNPRFKDEADGKVTVMNSCVGQQWGHEERDRQNFTFVPGQPFEIKIHCTSNGFNVKVNNRDLPTYKHRTNPTSIDTLRIYNDVSLSRVTVE